jgi:hypothetical protein
VDHDPGRLKKPLKKEANFLCFEELDVLPGGLFMHFYVGVNYFWQFFIYAVICNISCNFGSKVNRTKA